MTERRRPYGGMSPDDDSVVTSIPDNVRDLLARLAKLCREEKAGMVVQIENASDKMKMIQIPDQGKHASAELIALSTLIQLPESLDKHRLLALIGIRGKEPTIIAKSMAEVQEHARSGAILEEQKDWLQEQDEDLSKMIDDML